MEHPVLGLEVRAHVVRSHVVLAVPIQSSVSNQAVGIYAGSSYGASRGLGGWAVALARVVAGTR